MNPVAAVDRAIRPAPAPDWSVVRGRWLTGHMQALQRDPLRLYRDVWRAHGDYVKLRLFPGFYFFLAAHPAAVDHVLFRHARNYEKPNIFNRPVSSLTGNGILTSSGELWQRQRRLMQPAFHRAAIARLAPQMSAAIEGLAVQWERHRLGAPFDVVPEMMRLSLQIASTTLFGVDVSDDADEFGIALRTGFSRVGEKMSGRPTAPDWFPSAKSRAFRAARSQIDRIVLKIIETRRRTPAAAPDLLTALLAARDQNGGAGMTDEQLKDEAVTLLIAGHETVGASLSWTWHLLTTQPCVQEALFDETWGQLRGAAPTFDDLDRLPLVNAVYQESLRLYPPAWGQPRQAISADEIEGRRIPKKVPVMLLQWLTHRHPDFWSQPDEFLPERFLPGADAPPRGAYFPFGGGPRVCIGAPFAMIEAPLAIATLVQRFRFQSTPGHEVIPDPTFTLRPKTGVLVEISQRSPSPS